MHPIVFKDHTGPEGGLTTVTDFAWTSGTAGSSYCLEHPVLQPLYSGVIVVSKGMIFRPFTLGCPTFSDG